MNEYIKGGKQKACEFCKKQFTTHPSSPNGGRTRYCSSECSQKASVRRNTENRRNLNLGAKLGLSGGKIGKIAEFVTAIDLIKRDWNVYTAFEDTHPFDILAIKGERMLKIEVKTGTILPSGKVHYSMKKNQEQKHDILAVVTNLQDIKYEPEIEE